MSIQRRKNCCVKSLIWVSQNVRRNSLFLSPSFVIKGTTQHVGEIGCVRENGSYFGHGGGGGGEERKDKGRGRKKEKEEKEMS